MISFLIFWVFFFSRLGWEDSFFSGMELKVEVCLLFLGWSLLKIGFSQS